MEHTTRPNCESLDSAPTTPQHDHEAPILTTTTLEEPFSLHYETPLYTEINIPLPRLPPPTPQPQTLATTTDAAPAPSRGRSHTLSALSPFRHRRSCSSSSTASSHAYSSSMRAPDSRHSSEEWPRIRRDRVKSREVHAMMDLRHQNKRNRSGTVDALAVVPAVLVLSAELFTPGAGDGDGDGGRGRGKKGGGGRWEDGIR
ncbi:hypothetical protein BDW02DRAFT_582534 [Decorospora gaudefroyi]|uniref:Uncharacterized protein n=1 Tax=Decorospora gaudefroyi TaxID=184978 RepID=A0A6A5K243_9PLEO|nr:hypothetical protein BDW02DRAFT_582534 [Decorospora gaudefroyi]